MNVSEKTDRPAGRFRDFNPPDPDVCAKRLIGQLIEIFTAELNIPRRSFSATTWKRRDIHKGSEADECYYLVVSIHPSPNGSGRKRRR